MSVFLSKWNDLHALNNCSHILPIFEYCCLNWFCKLCQSSFIGLRDLYHNLASPTNDRQNLWTFTPSWNWCVFIQSFILSSCPSPSSCGFPEISGLKCDQFNCGTCCACYVGCCRTWGAGSAGTSGACGLASAMLILCYVC